MTPLSRREMLRRAGGGFGSSTTKRVLWRRSPACVPAAAPLPTKKSPRAGPTGQPPRLTDRELPAVRTLLRRQSAVSPTDLKGVSSGSGY